MISNLKCIGLALFAVACAEAPVAKAPEAHLVTCERDERADCERRAARVCSDYQAITKPGCFKWGGCPTNDDEVASLRFRCPSEPPASVTATNQAAASTAPADGPTQMQGCITDKDCAFGAECWPNEHRCMPK